MKELNYIITLNNFNNSILCRFMPIKDGKITISTKRMYYFFMVCDKGLIQGKPSKTIDIEPNEMTRWGVTTKEDPKENKDIAFPTRNDVINLMQIIKYIK